MELQRVVEKGKDWTTIILAAGLAVTVIVLAVSVLWGVVQGREQLGETGTRVLTVAISGIVGILGFKMGTNSAKRDGEPPRP